MNQFGKIYIPKIKIDKKRIIKFLVILGMLFAVDSVFNLTSVFNRYIQTMISLIFGIKTEDIHLHSSLPVSIGHSSLPISIAVLWSSKLNFTKKVEYSASLIIIYAWIFTLTTYLDVKYPYLSFYFDVIVFITISFPIILWILS